MKHKLITYLGLYAVLIAATLPLILELVPPNAWYGFRLPGIMLSEPHWYALNALGGRLFAGALVICAALNAALFRWNPGNIMRYAGIVNATLILLSFWLVSLELLEHLPT